MRALSPANSATTTCWSSGNQQISRTATSGSNGCESRHTKLSRLADPAQRRGLLDGFTGQFLKRQQQGIDVIELRRAIRLPSCAADSNRLSQPSNSAVQSINTTPSIAYELYGLQRISYGLLFKVPHLNS